MASEAMKCRLFSYIINRFLQQFALWGCIVSAFYYFFHAISMAPCDWHAKIDILSLGSCLQSILLAIHF